MKMKKNYIELECEIIKFENEDIITSSASKSIFDYQSSTGDNDVDYSNTFGL